MHETFLAAPAVEHDRDCTHESQFVGYIFIYLIFFKLFKKILLRAQTSDKTWPGHEREEREWRSPQCVPVVRCSSAFRCTASTSLTMERAPAWLTIAFSSLLFSLFISNAPSIACRAACATLESRHHSVNVRRAELRCSRRRFALAQPPPSLAYDAAARNSST